MIIVARLGAAYGVRGWLKLQSFTDPVDNILRYRPLYIQQDSQWQPLELDDIKPHGNGIIIKIRGCDDRDQTRDYTNQELAIEQDQLPNLPKGEYYWHELEGLRVITKSGVELGHVDHLFATGSNDVLVVKGDKEHLIPYLKDVVLKVDLEHATLTVNWESDF